MIASWSMDLADYLGAKVDQTSLRDVAATVQVGKTTIDNIVNRRNSSYPELETLVKISKAYGVELYRVIEMLGIDLQLPGDSKSRSLRLAVTLERMPMLRTVVEKIVTLSETRIRSILDALRFHLRAEDGSMEGVNLSPEATAWLAPYLEDEQARRDLEQAIQEAKARRERDDQD